MTNKLTYDDLENVCDDAAKEIVPDYPTENSYFTWQLYKDADLTNLDENIFEEVLDFVLRWRWLENNNIGDARSLELALLLPEDELKAAQSYVQDYIGESSELYELARRIVEAFLRINITRRCEDLIEERKEQAGYKLEELEPLADKELEDLIEFADRIIEEQNKE